MAHTQVRPENVAVVLESRDFPELRNFGSIIGSEEEILLFVAEVTVLAKVFRLLRDSNALFSALFAEKSRAELEAFFFKFCVQHRSLADFLQPPFRVPVLGVCSRN